MKSSHLPGLGMGLVFSVISAVLLSANAFAWGPHSEIAQAALDAMGANDPLVQRLGPDAKRLAQYVWMADFRQTLLVRSDEVFYADDYLLFPAAPRHYQHICPEVKQTYSPYFRRALQALRTESTHNASRWIGSLLHFTTDTGSPPHAAGFLGPAHSKMESWVDAKLIHIPGYQPQLLGADDAAAEAGFLRRMEGLIEFSKERAQRCRADVDGDRRAAVEPVVLESALETARVTADLLHTLGVLAAKATDDATLTGRVIVPKIEHATMSRLPAKVVLLGTSYSTLTEPDGTFTFRHLPAGEYRLVVIAPGSVSEAKPVSLVAAATVTLEPVDLSQGTDGNLVRNGTLALRWVSAEAFDHWSLRSPPGKLAAKTPVRDWDGEWIPLQSGVTYHLTARWKATAEDANGPQVFLRTKAKPDGGSITSDSAPVVRGTKEVAVIGSPEAAWAQVCIRTSQSPDTVLEAVSLRQAPPTAATSAPRDPVMRLKLLPPGPDNPRNSEVAFLRLKDGRILMVYSHFTGKQGADESPCHLAGRYSSDGGKTWTKDDVLVVAGEEAKTRNVMSPSLLRLQDGRIALFYLRLNGPLDDRPIMRVSTDEAQTWSEPRVCIGDDELGLYILNNDRAVQLKSGRLVLPLARHDDVTKPNKFNDYPRTLCYLSDDSGQTWRRSKTVLDGIPASGNRVALQEPGVVELKDGRVMMFCRTHTGYIYRSFSGDGGDTWWPAVRYPGLFAPVSAAAIERIPKTGDLMMAWNDHTGIATAATSPYKGKRTPYNVAISRDEGETWENVKTLEDDPDGWYCYTAIEFVGNDVLLAHCAGWQPRPEDAPGHETKLALTQLTRFPLSFLYDGPPVSATPVFTKGKRIQVFVLTGQSNSLGTTEDPDEKDITPGIDPLDAQIPFFWSNRSTRAGDGPAMLYGNSGGKIVTLRAQQGEGPDPMFWGPEIGFGRTLAAAGTKDFMIVKASRGGGGNSYWLKGNGDDHMYRHVVETVREAVRQLPTGTEFEIVGLLYLQGESDHAAEAAVAGERLRTLAANLRKDLPNAAAMKVLIGGVVPSGKDLDLVREQQSALPALDPSFRYLDNMAWKPRRYDGAHYVKPAKLELGQRLGKMWLESAKTEPTPVPKGLSASAKRSIHPVLIRNEHNPVLRVIVEAPVAPDVRVSAFSFTLEGTDDLADIEALSLFATGDQEAFQITRPIAEPVPPAATITFRAALTLKAGKNIFWLSCRLKNSADLSHRIAAACSAIETTDGRLIPTLSVPGGRQRIGFALRIHHDDGVPIHRIPALATTPKGTLLCAYDRRATSRDLQGNIDIGLSRSTDAGRTWEPGRVIMDMGEYGGLPQDQNGCSDPGLIVDQKTGEIFCFAVWMNGKPGKHQWTDDGSGPGFKIGKSAQFMMVRSTDDGLTWSKPENLTRKLKQEAWWLLAPSPQQGINLPDGTLVMPVEGRDGRDKLSTFATIMISRDHGATWTVGKPAFSGGNECQAAQLGDGSIMLNIRNDHERFRAVAVTHDLGQTWQAHATSRNTLIEPNCNGSLLRFDYESGGAKQHVLLFANPHTQQGRTHQTIQVSFDDGKTWPESHHLLLDEGRGSGYPSLTRVDDGHVGIVYEGMGDPLRPAAQLVFEKLSLSELLKR